MSEQNKLTHGSHYELWISRMCDKSQPETAFTRDCKWFKMAATKICKQTDIVKMFLKIICVISVLESVACHKYSEKVNVKPALEPLPHDTYINFRTLEKPFRMAKLNVLWSKSQLVLLENRFCGGFCQWWICSGWLRRSSSRCLVIWSCTIRRKSRGKNWRRTGWMPMAWKKLS